MSEDQEMNPTGSQIRYGGRYPIGHTSSRSLAKRLVALVLLVLLAFVFFAGCGAGTRGAGTVIKSGPGIVRGVVGVSPSSIPKYVPRPFHLPNPTSHRVIARELATADTEALAEVLARQALARQAFADLRAGDIHDWLLAEALCAGMEGLASQGEDTRASEDAWQEFLYGYPENYAENVVQNASFGYAPLVWIGRVEGMMTAWDLAQVNGNLARMYFDTCVIP